MLNCKYTSKGCSFEAQDINDHETEKCPYRLVRCPRKNCTYPDPIEFQLLEDHYDDYCDGDEEDDPAPFKPDPSPPSTPSEKVQKMPELDSGRSENEKFVEPYTGVRYSLIYYDDVVHKA